jgi:hypothetical protein
MSKSLPRGTGRCCQGTGSESSTSYQTSVKPDRGSLGPSRGLSFEKNLMAVRPHDWYAPKLLSFSPSRFRPLSHSAYGKIPLCQGSCRL